tara:strand:+ start:852 stop:1178 length:327 start_codon:yes stop_codon:yes gene_type:complete
MWYFILSLVAGYLGYLFKGWVDVHFSGPADMTSVMKLIALEADHKFLKKQYSKVQSQLHDETLKLKEITEFVNLDGDTELTQDELMHRLREDLIKAGKTAMDKRISGQ